MLTCHFLNVRSGHGKTLGVIVLAHLLNKKYQKRVLVIDLGDTSDISDYYSQSGISSKEYNQSIKQLLETSNPSAKDYIRSTNNEHIDYIAGHTGSISVTVDNRYNLASVINQVEEDYDFCLIDGGSDKDSHSDCGLLAANVVYIPICCDNRGIYSMQQSLQLIQNTQRFKSNLVVAGCYISKYNVANKEQYNLIKSQLGDTLLPAIIPYDEKFVDEILFGVQVLDDVSNELPIMISYDDLINLIMLHDN